MRVTAWYRHVEYIEPVQKKRSVFGALAQLRERACAQATGGTYEHELTESRKTKHTFAAFVTSFPMYRQTSS